ncbi:MAG TPA: citrate/2-methylcitrate synthase [Acidimicrobiales bacterium]|jgi:citrate synthase
MADDWLTAAEAAARLGVKPETLYAYVSRGLLPRERPPGSRSSRFRRVDVDALRERSHPRSRDRVREVLIDSAVTLLDPAGRLLYRGREVTELAGTWSFERTAEWLWTGTDVPVPEWRASRSAVRVGRRVLAALPADASVADRLRTVVAALATTDPMRHDRRPEAVVVTARGLIAGMVASLDPAGAATPAGAAPASVASMVWRGLSPRTPRAADLALLDRVLVLVADHELAASTFAARIAAATWADPYLVVLSGMSALGGSLHGGASGQAVVLLRELVAGTPADRAVGERLRAAETIPGFGHAVYRERDPRAVDLFAALDRVRLPARLRRAVDDLVEVMATRGGPGPNVDLAVAVMTEAAGMPADAGEALYAVARTAGWIAHGMEEYEHRLRYRPRANYTGPVA